jgi:hypothetical protein
LSQPRIFLLFLLFSYRFGAGTFYFSFASISKMLIFADLGEKKFTFYGLNPLKSFGE